MSETIRKSRTATAALALAAGLVLALSTASAQVSPYGEKQMGEPASDQLPTVLKKATIVQKLNTQIPLDGQFVDDTGQTVRMGDYFGKRPAILSLVYYNCPMLCSEELDGLVSALKMVKFKPGRDFDVIVVSIDPSETPELAAQKKTFYLKRYGHPETANGWHFLTGGETAISALANATGFGYVRVPGPDGKMTQFAHASAIQLLTPDGRISQYYLGVEFSPNDLQLGLVEASDHKIGSPVDNILTYCYHYDPMLNRHSLIIARIVQLGCLVTLLCLGSFMIVMFRRDRKRAKTTSVPNWKNAIG
ncbi:SCO family protein [Alloacidobacterium sp.]|uniref:SCO family protein n=1 Tax=Alloacidobacterium sp. TaxID=2951999 RepID=UPI002D319FE3|nr:SCO family protein [Alloacidobacterium sp.]HYK37566.1 SCO family protein [Alloacidobacterium sp.]